MILEVHALSQTLSYNTTTNHSIQYSSLISLLHSLYSHRSDNSIVSATQNLCRHQRRIKTHKIYIRGIIILYISSTVILISSPKGWLRSSLQDISPAAPSIDSIYIYHPTGSCTMLLGQPLDSLYTLPSKDYSLYSQIRQGKFESKHTQSNCCISSP